MLIRTVLLLWFTVLAATPAFADKLVVIASTDASEAFEAGKIVEIGTVLALDEGASVTLLSKSGAILKFSGPYSEPLVLNKPDTEAREEKDWSSKLSSIAKVVSKDVKRTNVIGSSREAGTALFHSQPDVWTLTVDSSGHRCLNADGANLWRKNAVKSLNIDLRSDEETEKGLTWQAGQNQMELPKKFVRDGTLIVMKFDKQPRRFNVHLLPSEIRVDDWGKILHWMIKKECNRQADLLVDSLHTGQIAIR